MANHGTDDRCRLTRLNQCLVAGDAVRGQRAEVADRLDEIGFTLAVSTDEKIDAWLERNIGAAVVTKRGEGQMLYIHNPRP